MSTRGDLDEDNANRLPAEFYTRQVTCPCKRRAKLAEPSDYSDNGMFLKYCNAPWACNFALRL
jgi:hypothetical protein